MKSNISRHTANLFRRFGEYIRSERCRSLSRKYKNQFVRIYKFPWYDVILYMIFRHEKSTPTELSSYFSAIGKSRLRISRQALFKAVHKLNPNVFIDLIHKFAEFFYQSKLVKTYKGYILLAEDGTTLELRPTPRAIGIYGYVTGGPIKDETDIHNAVSRSSALYDVTNGLIVDFTMKSFKYSEMPLAIGHLQRMHNVFEGRKVIYLADRYYGNTELFVLLESYNMNYCIRGKSYFFKHYIEQMKSNDEWIRVTIDKAWMKRLKYSFAIERFKENPIIRIRVVKKPYQYTLETGETCTENLIYFTNLSNDKFNTEDIIHLYAKRWDIECSYKTLKTDYEWERYFSADDEIERSSIYAKVLYHNLIGVIRKEIDESLSMEKSNNKYTYRIDIVQLSNGLRANGIMRMIRTGNYRAIEKIMDVILGMINKIKVPIRPNRHHARWGVFKFNSHPHRFSLDGRNFPRVANIHGKLVTVKP